MTFRSRLKRFWKDLDFGIDWLILVLVDSLVVYFIWNYLAPIYLYQAPAIYQHVSFFNVYLILWGFGTFKRQVP